MAALPLHQRTFHAFLSHAHTDKTTVDKLYTWLREVADIPVWYDAHHLPTGGQIVSYLPQAIDQCRAMILILSQASVRSNWVQDEYSYAIAQRNDRNAPYKDFRILPIRIEDCDVPGFLKTMKYIDLYQGQGDAALYGQLLKDLYYDDVDLEIERTRDLYISRTWRENEKRLADYTCQLFADAGFRLVGDSQDRPMFGENRVQSIMSSCGGFVAILPHRGHGATSEYILDEIKLARQLALPCVLVAEPAIGPLPIVDTDTCIRIVADEVGNGSPAEIELRESVDIMKEAWRSASKPHYTFFSTNSKTDQKQRDRLIKQILQRVTAMPCVMRDDIDAGQRQQVSADRIASAVMLLADISGDSPDHFDLDVCIEVGIARGAKRQIALMALGTHRDRPFMLDDQKIWYYADDVELVGLTHKLAYPFRRRVLNWELPR